MSRKKTKIQFEEYNESKFIGKIVLIGIRYFYKNERELGARQYWGTIIKFNKNDGLQVDMSNSGDIGHFPPMLDYMIPAEPGVYTLKGTGEEIEDPDYLFKMIHNTHNPEDIIKWAEFNKKNEKNDN